MDERQLIERAIEARKQAYAPYSGFSVGAALLTGSGAVITGCNVENAAYGHTICAERAAVVRAIAEGMRDFRAIAIIGPHHDRPLTPCGSCRQVLNEFAPEMIVLTADGDTVRRLTVRDLLPHAFGPTDLDEARR